MPNLPRIGGGGDGVVAELARACEREREMNPGRGVEGRYDLGSFFCLVAGYLDERGGCGDGEVIPSWGRWEVCLTQQHMLYFVATYALG